MPLWNLRALRVSVVKQDVLPLQGHCLNRSCPTAPEKIPVLQGRSEQKIRGISWNSWPVFLQSTN